MHRSHRVKNSRYQKGKGRDDPSGEKDRDSRSKPALPRPEPSHRKEYIDGYPYIKGDPDGTVYRGTVEQELFIQGGGSSFPETTSGIHVNDDELSFYDPTSPCPYTALHENNDGMDNEPIDGGYGMDNDIIVDRYGMDNELIVGGYVDGDGMPVHEATTHTFANKPDIFFNKTTTGRFTNNDGQASGEAARSVKTAKTKNSRRTIPMSATEKHTELEHFALKRT